MRTKFLIERVIEYVNASLQIQKNEKFRGQNFFRVRWGDKAYITVILMIRGQKLKTSLLEITLFCLNVTNRFRVKTYIRNKFC